MKEQQQQNPDQKPSEIKISHLPDKEFEVVVIRMLTKLGRTMEEHSENFSREKI